MEFRILFAGGIGQDGEAGISHSTVIDRISGRHRDPAVKGQHQRQRDDGAERSPKSQEAIAEGISRMFVHDK